MIVLQSIDNSTFRLNGLKYAKNFMCIIQGSTQISIYNAFDTSQQLIPAFKVNEIQIDGIVYTTIKDCIDILTPLLFNKNLSSSSTNTNTGINGEIGYLSKWVDSSILGESKFYEDNFGIVLDGNNGDLSPTSLNSKFSIVDGFQNFTNKFGIVWGGGDNRPSITGNKDERVIDIKTTNTIALRVNKTNNVLINTTEDAGATLSINSTSTYVAPKYGCSGDIVYFGKGDDFYCGSIYRLDTNLNWKPTNINSYDTGFGLLAIALGKSVSEGMLIKGTATFEQYYQMHNGEPLYLSDSNDGEFSNSIPNNRLIRIIGYCINEESRTIYFNPDNMLFNGADSILRYPPLA